MRTILMAALMVGCGSAPADPDASQDAFDSWRTHVGERCDARESLYCETGTALCYESVCRAPCVNMTCEAGAAPVGYMPTQTQTFCVCVPQ